MAPADDRMLSCRQGKKCARNEWHCRFGGKSLGHAAVLNATSSQWTRHVDRQQTDAPLAALRHSLARGPPFSLPRWQTTIVRQLRPGPLCDQKDGPKKSDETTVAFFDHGQSDGRQLPLSVRQCRSDCFERRKLAQIRIEREHFPGFKLVNPAMQL